MMPIDGPGYFAVDKLTFAIFGGYENLDILRKHHEARRTCTLYILDSWKKDLWNTDIPPFKTCLK